MIEALFFGNKNWRLYLELVGASYLAPKKQIQIHYCWWKKFCASWYGKYPIIYMVLYIQTVVVSDFWAINSMSWDSSSRLGFEGTGWRCFNESCFKDASDWCVSAHSASGPWDKSLNFFFPKHVIPESLKFSHWLSESVFFCFGEWWKMMDNTQHTTDGSCWICWFMDKHVGKHGPRARATLPEAFFSESIAWEDGLKRTSCLFLIWIKHD